MDTRKEDESGHVCIKEIARDKEKSNEDCSRSEQEVDQEELTTDYYSVKKIPDRFNHPG